MSGANSGQWECVRSLGIYVIDTYELQRGSWEPKMEEYPVLLTSEYFSSLIILLQMTYNNVSVGLKWNKVET